ncbi:MAG: hypothetical protein WCX27_00290 [Candidatus Paceibacterota bacterium]|jgi:hypothetical protein
MTDRHKTRKILKIVTITLLVLLLFGYTGYEIQKVMFGPRIEILSPKNGATVSDPLILISGVAKNIKEISLDDRKIFIDEAGNFKEEMLISHGYNVFSIKASDKFDRKIERIIEVIYKSPVI